LQELPDFHQVKIALAGPRPREGSEGRLRCLAWRREDSAADFTYVVHRIEEFKLVSCVYVISSDENAACYLRNVIVSNL
jgi:hypothetical protein